jgi:Family of unknown function (DUF5761)
MSSRDTVYNGRVDLLSPMPAFQINPREDARDTTGSFAQQGLQGQIAPNPISNLFFCPKNIDILQDGIRYRIWKETEGRYVIGRQSDTELRVVMRSIYFQYARHLPNDIVGQVRDLNAKVLEWVVPEVRSNLLQYERYRQDASQMPVPLAHPPLMTQKGTKVLEIKRFL